MNELTLKPTMLMFGILVVLYIALRPYLVDRRNIGDGTYLILMALMVALVFVATNARAILLIAMLFIVSCAKPGIGCPTFSTKVKNHRYMDNTTCYGEKPYHDWLFLFPPKAR